MSVLDSEMEVIARAFVSYREAGKQARENPSDWGPLWKFLSYLLDLVLLQ